MRWRRTQTSDVVVAWRADRDAVRALLEREEVPAVVGPHRNGWTVARLLVSGEEVVEPRGRRLVDLVDDAARSLGQPGITCFGREWGGALLVACAPGRLPTDALLPGVDRAQEADRSSWAALLTAIDALDRLPDVLDAAASSGPVDKRARDADVLGDTRPWQVAAAAGLPPQLLDPNLVGDPAPYAEVVVARAADAMAVEIAASVAGTPLWRADVGDTALLVPDSTVRTMLPVAAAVASRTAALVLWRQGDVRGYLLVDRGDLLEAHVWGGEWEVVRLAADLDDELRDDLRLALAPASGDAALLRDKLLSPAARAEADVVELRSLLRRPSSPEVVSDLCEALGADRIAAAVLEGSVPVSELPGAVRVVEEPASMPRAVMRAAFAPRPDDPWIVRVGHRRPWWYRLLDLVWAVAASAWAWQLWADGGLARVWSVLLALTAVASVVDAVLPARTPATSARPRLRESPVPPPAEAGAAPESRSD